MPLDYLTGDNEVGATNRKKKRQEKKKDRKEKRKDNKSKRKDKVKTKLKKVARIGLAPSRGAFLTVVTLNLLKTGTKLARIYNKPGGQQKLKTFWVDKFKGNFDELKKAIAKGSKTQIASDDMGIAPEVILATSAPILLALIPLIKEFVAGGDTSEMSEFNTGIDSAKHELATNPEFTTDNMNMPEDSNVAEIQKPPGETEPVFGGFDLKNVFAGSWVNISYNLFKGIFFYLAIFLMIAKEHPIVMSVIGLTVIADLLGVFKNFNPLQWLRRKQ